MLETLLTKFHISEASKGYYLISEDSKGFSVRQSTYCNLLGRGNTHLFLSGRLSMRMQTSTMVTLALGTIETSGTTR